MSCTGRRGRTKRVLLSEESLHGSVRKLLVRCCRYFRGNPSGATRSSRYGQQHLLRQTRDIGLKGSARGLARVQNAHQAVESASNVEIRPLSFYVARRGQVRMEGSAYLGVCGYSPLTMCHQHRPTGRPVGLNPWKAQSSFGLDPALVARSA